MDNIISTGANKSHIDPRTISHTDLATPSAPLVSGGTQYAPEQIEHQHGVGICTAISLIQNREKANGKKYSPDFQYLLQKKFYDLNWDEGSSLFNALKVGKNYGFLPLDMWAYTTEQDRYLPYGQYIAKLQAISDSEIQRLIGLCVDKIPGYASVNVQDSQSIAKAINESDAGILCRYGCQSNWWLPSWRPEDIDPLRNAPETSGHAIIMSSFDYSVSTMQKLANTWGTTWDYGGTANINWTTYPPTEAWTILKTTPVIPFKFMQNLWFGMRNDDVKRLQARLNVIQTGFFGSLTLLAVMVYQSSNGITPTGFVGPLTRAQLNRQ